jgi:outer membrane protein assembly factor BamB
MLTMMRTFFTLLLLLISTSGFSEEWFQFLGPNRNGAIADDSFVKAWLSDQVKELWRAPIGEGYSGIVTAGDRIFTMDSKGGEEFVVCLRASDGKELWRVRTGPSPRDVYGGLGPRVTPAINGNRLFTVSAGGDLLALQVIDGKVIWQRSLSQDHGWRPPAEGTSCSPLILDERIYVINGGNNGRAIAAFNRDSGKTLWMSENDRTSYSSPVRWDFQGIKQTLFLMGANLFSVEASSGRLLWKYPWPTYDFVNAATPLIIQPDRVFISSGYDQGAAMLRITNDEGSIRATEIWRNREMKNHYNNSVYFDGVIYGFDNSIFKALDAETGTTLWREQGFGAGSVILSGSNLLILSERGDLICAKANRKKLSIEKQLKVMSGRNWTPLSLSGLHLYLRNQNEVVHLIAAQ